MREPIPEEKHENRHRRLRPRRRRSSPTSFDRAGHEVIDHRHLDAAFDRLPATFGGTALRGDGTDEDTLRRAGRRDADLFIALTEGDNRNVMAAQLAAEALGAKQ